MSNYDDKNRIKGMVVNMGHKRGDEAKKSLFNDCQLFIDTYDYDEFKSIFDSNEHMIDCLNFHSLTELVVDRAGDIDTPIDFFVAKKYLSLRQRSDDFSGEFDLTLSDIKKMYLRKKCQITGETIGIKNGRNTLSFERIDNSIGYTRENTIIVARWVNDLKNRIFEQEGKFQIEQTKGNLKSIIKMMEFYKNKA